MPTTPISVVADRKAVQYIGTNSAEIAVIIDDFTVTSEVGGVLTFTSDGTSRSVPTGGYITYWEGAVREDTFANEDDFRDAYRDGDVLLEHVHDLKLTTGAGYLLEDEA